MSSIHKNAKKFYRIQLYSANVMPTLTPAGNSAWYDGYYQIDIPDILDSDKYQIAVEKFNMNLTANAGLGYIISCDTLPQANSYSTLTQSTNYSILTYNGSSFVRFIDFSSIGIPLKDKSWMRTNRIHIYFSTLNGVPITTNKFYGASPMWSMSLIIFPIEKSEY
jgi:hypothetical protein